MSVRIRNVAVGLTVMIGLAMVGGMILLFSGLPSWAQGGYDVQVTLDNAGGLREGDTVQLNGKVIGKVNLVAFRGGDPAKGLVATAHIDEGINIPASVWAEVEPPAVGMGASILKLNAPLTTTGSANYLATDGSAVVAGRVGGLMQRVNDLALSLQQLMTALNTGAGPDGTTLPADSPVALLTTSLKKVNKTLDATLAIVADSENQQNLKLTLANAREFSTQALAAMDDVKDLLRSGKATLTQAGSTMTEMTKATTRASSNVDQLTQNLIRNTEDISRALTTLNAGLAKMEQGEGTAGKLLNDPRLYNNLVDITDQMNSVMKDLQQLLKEWQDRGVGIRLR